jgi:hypothetical protein
MALKLPQQFLEDELAALVAFWSTRGTQTAHIFVNNITPGFGTLISSFVEASWPGYSPVAVSGWAPATWAPPDAMVQALGPVSFTVTGVSSVILYGYFITDGSGAYVWGERDLNAPVTLQPGQTYSVTLRRAHRNQGD